MENWKDISDYPGYQVSDQGNVRSFWERHRIPGKHGGTYRKRVSSPHDLPQSDDGNGYMKVYLNNGSGKKTCVKVHRLVAQEFIPHDISDDTVDHIKPGREGKLDNSVGNLRWIPRAENIQKAYRDGVCDERIRNQRKPIIAIDLRTGDERYFESIGQASEELGVDRSSISHVLNCDHDRTSHYTFEYAGREEKMLYGIRDY